MAKRKNRKKHTLKANYGCNPDGTPKKKAGESVYLTEEQITEYKKLKLI